jgi:hypothetical protein
MQWFQQEYAMAQASWTTLDMFSPGHLISWGTEIDNPSHSPDLILPDAYVDF